MKMLDLCSGLGGASQPMVDAGWNVLRIENNPMLSGVPNTQMMNVMDFNPKGDVDGDVDLIWASPPCLEFSNGYGAPKAKAQRAGKAYKPDLSLMKKCYDIIQWAKPRYWVIENVIGAIKDFSPTLGQPRQIIGSFALWGNFPYIHVDRDWTHTKMGPGSGDKHSSDPLRANYRGLIPYPIADSLRISLEEQRSILEYI
jgi:hypothetical protein